MARQLSVVLVVLVSVAVLVLAFFGQKPDTPRAPHGVGDDFRTEGAQASPFEESLEPVPQAAQEAAAFEEPTGGEIGATSEEIPVETELEVRVIRAKADPQTPPQSVIWRRSWQAQAVIQDWPGSEVLARKMRATLKGQPVEAAVDCIGFEPDWKEAREARSSDRGTAAGEEYVYVYGPWIPEGEEYLPEPPWSKILLRVLANEHGIVDDVRVSVRDPEEHVKGEQRQSGSAEYRERVSIDPSQLRPLREPAPARNEETLQAERAEWERLMARFQQWEAEAEAQKEAWAEEYGIER